MGARRRRSKACIPKGMQAFFFGAARMFFHSCRKRKVFHKN
jgi:hypothetical protein